tara:strand:+ start:63 stop:233 length:171 start_codon:yes stop_codon:yes gene_type:complete
MSEKRLGKFLKENKKDMSEIFKNRWESISKDNREMIVVYYYENIRVKQPSSVSTHY